MKASRRPFKMDEKDAHLLLGRLQSSKERLNTIIDHMVVSVVDFVRHHDINPLLAEHLISVEEYEEMVQASVILREAEYHLRIDPDAYRLPNTEVVVNRLSVCNLKGTGKCVVIDEGTVLELLDMYERFGEVIQKLMEKGYQLDGPLPNREEINERLLMLQTSLRSIPGTVSAHSDTCPMAKPKKSSTHFSDPKNAGGSAVSIPMKSRPSRSKASIKSKRASKSKTSVKNPSCTSIHTLNEGNKKSSTWLHDSKTSRSKRSIRDGSCTSIRMPDEEKKTSSICPPLKRRSSRSRSSMKNASYTSIQSVDKNQRTSSTCLHDKKPSRSRRSLRDGSCASMRMPDEEPTTSTTCVPQKKRPSRSRLSVKNGSCTSIQSVGKTKRASSVCLHDDIKSENSMLSMRSASSTSILPPDRGKRESSVFLKPPPLLQDTKKREEVAAPSPSQLSLCLKPVALPPPCSTAAEENSDDEGCSTFRNIKIRIMCNVSESDVNEDKVEYVSPSKSPSDCYRVKLGDRPVSLRLAPDDQQKCGGTYCINTGSDTDDQEIKIFIKACSPCSSSAFTSASDICQQKVQQNLVSCHPEDPMTGAQRPRGGVKSMESTKNLKRRLQDSRSCSESREDSKGCCAPRIVININTPKCSDTACSCHETTKTNNQPKLNVMLDIESVDKSAIQVDGKTVKAVGSKKKVVMEQLMRERVCSSHEFDVTEIYTTLREQEIIHHDPYIDVELKKLGVDQLLRACRPAKCCRKAILNEKETMELPYCVSLRSLPLIPQDIDVIKQSIKMSADKKKKDLKFSAQETMNYYTNLNEDSFPERVEVPSFLPVYYVMVEFDKGRELRDQNTEKSVSPKNSFENTKSREIQGKRGDIYPVKCMLKNSLVSNSTKCNDFIVLHSRGNSDIRCNERTKFTKRNKHVHYMYKLLKTVKNYKRKIWKAINYNKVTNRIFLQESNHSEYSLTEEKVHCEQIPVCESHVTKDTVLKCDWQSHTLFTNDSLLKKNNPLLSDSNISLQNLRNPKSFCDQQKFY